MEYIGPVLEFLRLLLLRYLPAFFVFLGFLLFAPLAWLEVFGLGGLVAQYRPYVGAFFLFSVSVLLVTVVAGLWSAGKAKYDHFRLSQSQNERLHKLTSGEKSTLAQYMMFHTRSTFFSPTNGHVAALLHDGVLYEAMGQNDEGKRGYGIQEWAREYLIRHPELLRPDTATKTPVEQQ